MMPARPTRVALVRAVSSTAVADGLVLLDERRGTIYHLNHTGTVALSALIDSGYEAAVSLWGTRVTWRVGFRSSPGDKDALPGGEILDLIYSHQSGD